MATITLEELIAAIGRAEGWGGTPGRFEVYDSRTEAPWGVRDDARRFPELKSDPRLAYEWVVGKLTGKATPYVTQKTGITGFSGTVVPGLVDASGNVDASKIPLLAQKWAPTVGATNDPQGLNQNWLSNVFKFLGMQQSEGGGSQGSAQKRDPNDFWGRLYDIITYPARVINPSLPSANDLVDTANTMDKAADAAKSAPKALEKMLALVLPLALAGVIILLVLLSAAAKESL